MQNPHADHAHAALTITESIADGRILQQSWSICTCNLPEKRAELGPPKFQNVATAAQVAATNRAVEAVDSGVRLGPEPAPNREESKLTETKKRTRKPSAPIRRFHEDDTECKHRVSPRGKPIEEGCTGPAYYKAVCSCGCDAFKENALKVVVQGWKDYDWHGR